MEIQSIMNIFRSSKKEVSSKYGRYTIDYDSIQTIDDIKDLLKLSWVEVTIDNDKSYDRYSEAIFKKILIKD